MAGQSFKFDVDFRALDKMLTQLPKSMSKQVLRKSLRKAARPIRDQARKNAPPGRKHSLQKGMVISTKLHGRKVRAKRSVVMFVGADHNKAPHAHLVEFGTAPRQQKNGRYTGQMPANPFFRRAWESKKKDALNTLTETLEVELIAAAKRLASRAEAGKVGKNITKALLK